MKKKQSLYQKSEDELWSMIAKLNLAHMIRLCKGDSSRIINKVRDDIELSYTHDSISELSTFFNDKKCALMDRAYVLGCWDMSDDMMEIAAATTVCFGRDFYTHAMTTERGMHNVKSMNLQCYENFGYAFSGFNKTAQQ